MPNILRYLQNEKSATRNGMEGVIKSIYVRYMTFSSNGSRNGFVLYTKMAAY